MTKKPNPKRYKNQKERTSLSFKSLKIKAFKENSQGTSPLKTLKMKIKTFNNSKISKLRIFRFAVNLLIHFQKYFLEISLKEVKTASSSFRTDSDSKSRLMLSSSTTEKRDGKASGSKSSQLLPQLSIKKKNIKVRFL